MVRTRGACYTCGSPEHQARNCPHQPTQVEKQGNDNEQQNANPAQVATVDAQPISDFSYAEYAKYERKKAKQYPIRVCKELTAAPQAQVIKSYRICIRNDYTVRRQKEGLKPLSETKMEEQVDEVLLTMGVMPDQKKDERKKLRMCEYMQPAQAEGSQEVILPPAPEVVEQAFRLAELNGTPVRGLADSGAQASCITTRTLKKLEKSQGVKFPRVPCKIELVGFSETSEPVVTKEIVHILTRVNMWRQIVPYLVLEKEQTNDDTIIWGNNLMGIFGVAGGLAAACDHLDPIGKLAGWEVDDNLRVKRSLIDLMGIPREKMWDAMVKHNDFQRQTSPPSDSTSTASTSKASEEKPNAKQWRFEKAAENIKPNEKKEWLEYIRRWYVENKAEADTPSSSD